MHNPELNKITSDQAPPASFAAVVERWESCAALASALGARTGAVRQWRRRNRIPPRHWPRLVAAAAARGETAITFDLLDRLVAGNAGRIGKP